MLSNIFFDDHFPTMSIDLLWLIILIVKLETFPQIWCLISERSCYNRFQTFTTFRVVSKN